MKTSVMTTAQNLQDKFDKAGAGKLREMVDNPTAPTPGALAVIAQSILAIEQAMVEQASTPRRRGVFVGP